MKAKVTMKVKEVRIKNQLKTQVAFLDLEGGLERGWLTLDSEAARELAIDLLDALDRVEMRRRQDVINALKERPEPPRIVVEDSEL